MKNDREQTPQPFLLTITQAAQDMEPAMYSYTKRFGSGEIWYFALSSLLPGPAAICEKIRCSGVPVSIINAFNADAILVSLPLQSERRRRMKCSDLVAQKGKLAAEGAQAATQEIRNGFRASCNVVNEPSPHLKRFEQHFYTLLKSVTYFSIWSFWFEICVRALFPEQRERGICMTNSGQSGRKKQWNFSTHQGRLQLYYEWARLQIAEGRLSIIEEYTVEERCHFFAEWLRWVIARGSFNPSKRLPPYEKLAAVPLRLGKKEIAQVIRQLRDEQLLPPRKTRRDKGRPQWTKRDRWLWAYIVSMRAMRFDQIRRLAARASPEEIEGGLLSISRTSEIVKRWTDEKIAVFRSIFHAESGWCYLTRRGLREAGFTFRAEAPSARSLDHLYWINEVRMRLEEEYRTAMRWFSEREIQAQQERRQKGQKLTHIQDGILLLQNAHGGWEEIDIEVQVSKPAPGEVKEVMSDQFWTGRRNRPLRYYVNRLSRGVVRSAYREMLKEGRPMRPTIEVIDLENWQPLSLEEEQ